MPPGVRCWYPPKITLVVGDHLHQVPAHERQRSRQRNTGEDGHPAENDWGVPYRQLGEVLQHVQVQAQGRQEPCGRWRSSAVVITRQPVRGTAEHSGVYTIDIAAIKRK